MIEVDVAVTHPFICMLKNNYLNFQKIHMESGTPNM